MGLLPNPPNKLDVLPNDKPLPNTDCLRKLYAPLVHSVQVNSALHKC